MEAGFTHGPQGIHVHTLAIDYALFGYTTDAEIVRKNKDISSVWNIQETNKSNF